MIKERDGVFTKTTADPNPPGSMMSPMRSRVASDSTKVSSPARLLPAASRRCIAILLTIYFS